MSEALRLAEQLTNLKITVKGRDNAEAMEEAAAELRRLHQSEREGWRWADELEQERKRLHALNAELLEALKHAADCVQTNYLPDKCGHDWDDVIAKAEASNG